MHTTRFRVTPGVRLSAAFSGTAYAVLLMQTPSKWSFLITGLLALVLLTFLVFRTELLDRLFAPRHGAVMLLAGILSVSAVYTAKSTFYACCHLWLKRAAVLLALRHGDLFVRAVPWLAALAALPMAFGYFLWFTDFMAGFLRRLWRESDFTERLFLLGAGILFSMMIVFAYLCTQAFYGAHVGGHWYNFDLIYSSDSGYLVNQDVFRNVGAEQNDLRQPLYGLFAMPFAQIAWLLSWLLPFLSRPYITLWQIMQMGLYLIAVILVSRMMGLRGAEKALFLTLLSVCYPTLIFALSVEQYLVAVFYLILLIYLRKESPGGSLCFIGATGCLLTSGILFPLVTWDRDLRKFVKKTALLCLAFFAVTILSGRLTTFLDMPGYIARYGYYAGGDVDPVRKLMQYVNFAGACLAAPYSGLDFETLGHASWQLSPVIHWSRIGLLVISLAVCGVIVSRKDSFSRICAAWMGFSLLLLGIVGWGAIDNGLMLYTLYFGWAFAAMVFRFLDWAFRRVRPLKLAVLLALILLLVLRNATALREVLIFGTRFYPTLGGI